MAIKQRTTANPSPSVNLDQFRAETGKRAEEIYHKRQTTNTPGDALSDWLTAEKEIKSRRHIG